MLEIQHGRRKLRSPRMIKSVIRGCYKDLYKQKLVPVIYFRDDLVNKLSLNEARSLETLPSNDEIKQAVWSCESAKSPGPDGYNFNFIKRRSLIGTNFIACVNEFLRTSSLPRRANMTWVTLIPKVDEAKEIKEYRPISMR